MPMSLDHLLRHCRPHDNFTSRQPLSVFFLSTVHISGHTTTTASARLFTVASRDSHHHHLHNNRTGQRFKPHIAASHSLDFPPPQPPQWQSRHHLVTVATRRLGPAWMASTPSKRTTSSTRTSRPRSSTSPSPHSPSTTKTPSPPGRSSSPSLATSSATSASPSTTRPSWDQYVLPSCSNHPSHFVMFEF